MILKNTVLRNIAKHLMLEVVMDHDPTVSSQQVRALK
jgi:hypothetical protein